MACKYYDITISAIDLADATGNTDTSLNNKVFVSYTDCGGTAQNIFFDTAGTYVNYLCADNTIGVVGNYYQNNDLALADPGTTIEQGNCVICKYYDITISQIDIDSATGNTNPSENNVVFVDYTDCDGNGAQSVFNIAGTYINEICAYNTGLVIPNFYQNDSNYPTLNSTATEQGNCCLCYSLSSGPPPGGPSFGYTFFQYICKLSCFASMCFVDNNIIELFEPTFFFYVL